jgi:hypothetical protein
VLSRPSSLLRPPPTPSRLPTTSPSRAYRSARYPSAADRAEEGLPSSQDNPLTVPRPLRREVPQRPLQDQERLPWPSPIRDRFGSSFTRPKTRLPIDVAGFASCCGPASCSTPLRTRPLNHARGLHYRGPWRLPVPDSHQQAASSFTPGYTITTSSLSRRPNYWAHHGSAHMRSWCSTHRSPVLCSGRGLTAA